MTDPKEQEYTKIIHEINKKSKLSEEDEQSLIHIWSYSACLIKYCKNPTEKVCLEAVRKHPLVLMFIKEPSKDVCLEAVKNKGLVLMYIPSEHQTTEICLAAIRNDPFSLYWVANQTEEICLEAVRIRGMACLCVRSVTHKILEAAIQNDYDVSYLVKNGEIRVHP